MSLIDRVRRHFGVGVPADPKNAQRFAIWRVAFGAYLAFFVVRVAPYCVELYSREGMVSAKAIAARSILPLFVLQFDRPWQVIVLTAAAFVLSVLFGLGFHRRIVAGTLFLLNLWFLSRNPETSSPDLPFVQWLLLASVLIPAGDSVHLDRVRPGWAIPTPIRLGAWLTLALAYTYSVQGKLAVEDAWLDGSAFYYTLNNNPARLLWYGDFFRDMPKEWFYPLTWAAIFFEGCGPLLILYRHTRTLWIIGVTLMFFTILSFMNLAQVMLGMLMFQGFLLATWWDPVVRVVGLPRRVLNFLQRFRKPPPVTGMG